MVVHNPWSLKIVVPQNLGVKEGQVPVSHSCVHSLDHTHGLAAEANLPWHPFCHLPLDPCSDSQDLVVVCRIPHAAGMACHNLPQGADPGQHADPFLGTVQPPCDKSKRMTHANNDVVSYVLLVNVCNKNWGISFASASSTGNLPVLWLWRPAYQGRWAMPFVFIPLPSHLSQVTGEYLSLGSTVGKALLFASTCPDATYCCCCFVWCC